MTDNGLLYVISIDYTSMMWCTFQVDPSPCDELTSWNFSKWWVDCDDLPEWWVVCKPVFC